MTTYSYRSNMNSVTDTIEGIIFNAGVFVSYTVDQYTLNKYVPTRLDRYVDGVIANSDLIATNPVLNQEKFDTAANLGLTLAQAAQLPALVSGALTNTQALAGTSLGDSVGAVRVLSDGANTGTRLRWFTPIGFYAPAWCWEIYPQSRYQE